MTSSPSPLIVASNLIVFHGRLVAVAFGPDPAAANATVMIADIR